MWLNEQVKRNLSRFPEDFIFQLTKEEKAELVANCDRFLMLRHATTLPYAFTEHGAVMLACILNSEKAILANIQIVRVFTAIRELAFHNKDMLLKIEQIEQKIGIHDKEIAVIFTTLKKMLEPKPIPKRNRMGFTQGSQGSKGTKILKLDNSDCSPLMDFPLWGIEGAVLSPTSTPPHYSF